MSVELTKLSRKEIDEFVKENLPPGFVEEPKQPDQKRICVGLLGYDGTIQLRTAMCLLQALIQCAEQGWGFAYVLREGDSMVARGRNILASRFLEDPSLANCTDLVFIDTDLSWAGDEFVKLCSHNVDVVGGAYPYKDDTGDFPLRWPADGLFEENGLWQVNAVTPGFFRVTRKALDTMAKQMPWLEFKDRANPEGQRSWMFFDNVHRTNGIYDEGYIFCERWRTLNGKVYLDPDLNITHTGMKGFNHGTVRGWLEKKGQDFDRLTSEYPEIPPLVLMNKAMGVKVDLEAEQAKLA